MAKPPPLPPGSEVLTPEKAAHVRKTMLASTYAFGKFVCNFPDLDPDVHGQMAAWVERPTRLKLGQAPRGFLKTTTWTIADKLRRVTADPNLRVLLSNETAENTQKWIGLMQAIVMSPIYGGLFPDVVPDPRRVKWNQQQLELKRTRHWPEATIEGIGVGGASTSRHFNIIVNDDLVGKEARESPSVMQKAIDHRKLCWSLMIDASKSEVHDFGTRWHPNDLIDWVTKNVKNIDHCIVTIRKEDGEPRWPTRYPHDVMAQIRQEQGPEMWALQYENRAVGAGASEFDTNLLRYWHEEIDLEGNRILVLERPEAEGGNKRVKFDDTNRFQVIDAGLSPESRNARTANIAAALTPPTPTEPFDIVFLEAKATKSRPDQVVEEAYATYKNTDPLWAAIEVFGGHQAFFYWIPTVYPDMRIRKLPTDTHKSKDSRIREFWPVYLGQRRIYVHRSHTDMVDELAAYPNGVTVDLADAGAYLPKVWVPPNPIKPTRKLPKGVTAFDISDYDPDEMEQIMSDGRSPLTGYTWLLPWLALFCLTGLC